MNFATNKDLYKVLFKIGIVLYVVLLIMAVLFYKERSIFLDNSFFLFEILRNDAVTIQRYRFIVVLVEWLPLLAAKLSFSLKSVMIIYSVSFSLYYFFCYLLCGVLFKNYRVALVLLLLNCLIITHTFFWGLSELIQGMGLMMPLLAMLSAPRSSGFRALHYFVTIIAATTIAFAHPLTLFPFMFAVIFLLMIKESDVEKKPIIFSGVMFLIAFAIKKIWFTDAYDANSMAATGNIVKLFPDYLSLYSNQHFISNWWSIYYWIPISSLLIIITYLVSKQWWLLSLFLCSTIGYILLINIAYPASDTHDFYIENMYLPISIMLGFPLVYHVIPLFNKAKLGLLILFVLIMFTSVIRIYNQKKFYTARIDWLRGFISQNKNVKVLASSKIAPPHTILMTWATPYEFWLLSTVENNQTASIILSEDPSSLLWGTEHAKGFLTTWGLFDYNTLNPLYFKFQDTASNYKFVQ
jgi:hypothetical protein